MGRNCLHRSIRGRCHDRDAGCDWPRFGGRWCEQWGMDADGMYLTRMDGAAGWGRMDGVVVHCRRVAVLDLGLPLLGFEMAMDTICKHGNEARCLPMDWLGMKTDTLMLPGLDQRDGCTNGAGHGWMPIFRYCPPISSPVLARCLGGFDGCCLSGVPPLPLVIGSD
ncbi:hypothetical protein ACLOJK_004356 [Asimina triloba]